MSEMKTTSAKKTSGYNFGLKGWRIIGFEIVMLFFMTGITVDGLNTIVPTTGVRMYCFPFLHQHQL